MNNQNSQTTQMNNLTGRRLPLNSKLKTMTAVIGLMLAITGCQKSTKVTTKAGGHQVLAVIQGEHSIVNRPGGGTIWSPFGKVTIERARAQIDDAPWTTIPELAPVAVRISKGKVLLTAGAVTITRTVR